MKLLQIGKKKSMLALDLSGNGQKTWCNCSPKVLAFVKKNFKEGDNVEPTFGEDNTDGMKYITLVKKSISTPSTSTKPATDTKVCKGCGKPLTNSKYDYCYTCAKKGNKSNPTKVDSTELIKREAIAHAASRVMISLQGQLDINNVVSVYKTIYDEILKIVENR